MYQPQLNIESEHFNWRIKVPSFKWELVEFVEQTTLRNSCAKPSLKFSKKYLWSMMNEARSSDGVKKIVRRWENWEQCVAWRSSWCFDAFHQSLSLRRWTWNINWKTLRILLKLKSYSRSGIVQPEFSLPFGDYQYRAECPLDLFKSWKATFKITKGGSSKHRGDKNLLKVLVKINPLRFKLPRKSKSISELKYQVERTSEPSMTGMTSLANH